MTVQPIWIIDSKERWEWLHNWLDGTQQNILLLQALFDLRWLLSLSILQGLISRPGGFRMSSINLLFFSLSAMTASLKQVPFVRILKVFCGFHWSLTVTKPSISLAALLDIVPFSGFCLPSKVFQEWLLLLHSSPALSYLSSQSCFPAG